MGNRNSGFQSVVPLAADGSMQSGNSASTPPKRKKSMSKTAPAPPEAETPVSPVLIIPHDVSEPTIPTGSQSSLARSEPPVNEALISVDGFDFRQTETQLRRKGMADCEFECSQIEPYLFVGGYHVAGNWELLKSNGITRVVNLSSAVVNSHFISDPAMSYYTVNMVDGRQDDIAWFVCDVVQFIIKGRTLGEKTLIHCEKGVSRSCSFAIAYRMWSSGEKWKTAFDYVKERRPVCAPNTAFTCNLIEMGEIFGGAPNTRNLLFRCAYHLPHDPLTAVLKLCRNNESRKILAPSPSLLDPKGVFVIRCTRDNTNDQLVFIWKGSQASAEALDKARALAPQMYGIMTSTQDISVEEQGRESQLFLSAINSDSGADDSLEGSGTFRPNPPFEDLYDLKPSMEAALVFQKEHEQLRLSRDKPVMLTTKQTSIQGFDTSSETEYFKGHDPHESPAEFVGKLGKIPSLKLSEAALSGSRRNSHSKPVNLSRASSIRRDSKSEVDIGGSNALSLNLGALPSTHPVVPLLESPSGSRRERDEGRGLQYSSPIKEASFKDEDTPRSDVSSIPSARLGVPDKLGPIVTTIQSVEATPRGIVLESARSDPPVSHRGPSIRFNEPEQPSSADKKADDIKRPEPVSSSSSSSQHQGEVAHQELHKNSSRSRLLSLLSGGTAERPSSASEHKTLFRNNSKVVPLLADPAAAAPADTDRKLSNATDNTHPTHEMSRLTSPASPSEDKTSARYSTQPIDATPKKPMATLSLPTAALLRTPSVEKHPEHVSLSRGPTPAEELAVPLSNRDHGTIVPRLSLNKISNPVSPQLTKPTLFQAVVKKTSKRGDSMFEWQAMGVYDDDDLNETSLLLLLCPDLNHFVWVGAEFDVDKAGILVDSDADVPSDDEITRWVATVLNGEVKFDSMTGKQLTKRLRVCRSGEETEDFWTAFNAGF